MKQCAIIICILMLAASLGACGLSSNQQLPQTFRTEDKTVSIRVPEGWTQYETALTDRLVLVVQDSTGNAFAQIFRYTEVGENVVKDYISEAADFYGDSVTGSYDDVLVDGKTGYYFAYKATQTDENNNTFICQGYEYFVPFGKDIVEVDIFYRYTEDAPNNDQLAELKSIAESLKAK